MKKSNYFIFLIALFLFTFSAQAVTFEKIQTGLHVLDDSLYLMDKQSQTVSGARFVVDEIAYTFGIGESNIYSLHRQGYTYGQIYYLYLLSRQAHRPIDYFIKQKSNGIGWGELAHRLGVHPSVLNKSRVAYNKKFKDHKGIKETPNFDDNSSSKENPGKGKDKDNSNPGQSKGNGNGNGKGKVKS